MRTWTAHFSVYDNANFRFQNTDYYPVLQVKLMKKLLDLDDREGATVKRRMSGSFYFEELTEVVEVQADADGTLLLNVELRRPSPR